MKLDGKFHGIIAKNKDQSIVPQDQWIVFLAKDNALPNTLAFCQQECARQGADPAQIEAVEGLRIRVMQWRDAHPELCKTPDVALDEI